MKRTEAEISVIHEIAERVLVAYVQGAGHCHGGTPEAIRPASIVRWAFAVGEEWARHSLMLAPLETPTPPTDHSAPEPREEPEE